MLVIRNHLSSSQPKKARMDLLACLVAKQPANIQKLAQLLNRDYANVWRDCQALNSLGIIRLKKITKEDKKTQIQPLALYEKIVIEFPIKMARGKSVSVPLGA
jgi:predicted transcriptional regulator